MLDPAAEAVLVGLLGAVFAGDRFEPVSPILGRAGQTGSREPRSPAEE